MRKKRIAIIGAGDCASALIQGIHHYHDKTPDQAIGLKHWRLNGYTPSDIDARKVSKDVSEAIFANPDCTPIFCENIPPSGVTVHRGRVLDGYSTHMNDYDPGHSFVLSDQPGLQSMPFGVPSLRWKRVGEASW